MRPNANGYCALENRLHPAVTTTATNPARAAVTHYPAPTSQQRYVTAASVATSSKWSRAQQVGGVYAPPPVLQSKVGCTHPQTGFSMPHTTTVALSTTHQHQHQHPLRQLLHPAAGAPPNVFQTPNAYTPSSHPILQEASAAAHNYAKLPASAVNQQRINECAGIPLISTASSHLAPSQRHRILRKHSHSPCQAQKSLPLTDPHNKNTFSTNWPIHPTAYRPGGSISQLAAHAQGIPLLLNKQQGPPPTPNCNWLGASAAATATGTTSAPASGTTQARTPAPGYMRGHTHNRFVPNSLPTTYRSDKSRTLRYQNSAPAALTSRSKENIALPSKDAVQCLKPPETKDLGETSLPRIIKPRKRRKKDRKPANGVFLKLDTEEDDKMTKNTSAHVRLHKSTEDILNTLSCYEDAEAVTYNSLRYQLPQPVHRPALLPRTQTLTNEPMKSVYCNAPPKQHPAATHGICFCQECDPLRSIWDYPLRRSLSDSSATSSTSQTCSSTMSNASSDTASSCSSSNQVSDNDNFMPISATTRSRAEIVGVIGSNRSTTQDSAHGNTNSNSNSNFNAYASSSPISGQRQQQKQHQQQRQEQNGNANCSSYKPTVNGCVNDTNDSGYGDILSGINIAGDLFSHANITYAPMPKNVAATMASTASAATTATTTMMAAAVNTSTTSNILVPPTVASDTAELSLILLPETAETLLTASINEISRKLIETCANANELPNLLAGCSSNTMRNSFAVCSGDFASDSEIESIGNRGGNALHSDELLFNFEHLNIADAAPTASALGAREPIGRATSSISSFCSPNGSLTATSTATALKSDILTATAKATATAPASATNQANSSFFLTPTIDLLLDLNNNSKGLTADERVQQLSMHQTAITAQLQQQMQHQQQQQQQEQHSQQFFSNCFDLVWQNALEDDGPTHSLLGAMANLKTTFSPTVSSRT